MGNINTKNYLQMPDCCSRVKDSIGTTCCASKRDDAPISEKSCKSSTKSIKPIKINTRSKSNATSDLTKLQLHVETSKQNMLNNSSS